jgi:peptidoglycan/LPS O-acetylase OafA/YrhL
MKLDACSQERENNFDVLRLAAAAVVLVSHSFVVVGADEPHVGHFPLGTLGVEIFFAISGFLVAKSWSSRPGVGAFAVKRALRILPALLVVLAACAFVLGPIVSSASAGDYFGSFAPERYLVDDLASVVSAGVLVDVSHHLPGVFASNPAHSVNLSLWTLPIEVRAYMLVALLGAAGLLRKGMPLVAVGFLALSLSPAGFGGSALEFLRGGDGETAQLVALFAVAALAWVWRARIPLAPELALTAFVALVLSIGTPLERPVLLVSIPYLVLFLAYRSPRQLRSLTRHGDVSYGLYLLAFPVQQTIVQAWGGSLPAAGVVALIAFPITYLLALASWHGVEKRALRLKGVLTTPRLGRGRPDPILHPQPEVP